MTSSTKTMILNVLKIVLGVLGALFVVLAIIDLPANLQGLTVEEREAAMSNTKMGLMTSFTMFIVILGAILIVAFFLFGVITDTKKTLKAVLGYALAGLAFLLFYLVAKGSVTPVSLKEGIGESTLKATEAGLYLTLFMVVVGFALMLVGPLFRFIKK